ncbi:MAG: adenylosuccinate lyase [Erysipelotrichaceae bacterium]
MMIKRYSRDEMSDVFSEQSKWDAFLKVEILSAEAWSKLHVIPEEDVEKLWDKASFKIERILEIEKETKHDIVAFTRNISESLGEEKRWVHYGLTSTDVVDTGNGYILKQANQIIREDLKLFLEVLKNRALEFKNTPCIGRTHGVHADITSFGLKWALWYDEMQRNIQRFEVAAKEVEFGKISGAVGNFANTPPFVQDYVCENLGIGSAKISTQTLQRDRHANYLSSLALIATSMEKIAVEIRHLQRTEVREVEEGFGKGQKGSSAMPHKRNPISSENICGCARVIRGYMNAAFDDVALWHERDISHSAVERIILPDALILLDYMLHRYTGVLKDLGVFPERMLNNIYQTNGVIFTQRVMIALIDKGLAREQAYDLVQPLAMDAWQNNKKFKELLYSSDELFKYLNKAEIEECFTLDYYLARVDDIYQRVGIE